MAAIQPLQLPVRWPAWHTVQRAADGARPAWDSQLYSLFQRAPIDRAALTRACASGDELAATRLLLDAVDGWQPRLKDVASRLVLQTMQAGAEAAAAHSRTTERLIVAAGAHDPTPIITFGFDTTNFAARRWARDRAATLVTQVSEETRSALRRAVARAFSQKLPPDTLAKQITRLVGLTEGQAAAVQHLAERMAANRGGSVRAGRQRIRVPEDDDEFADRVDRATARYADQLLRQRTRTIARTETITSSNEGQRQLWRQAVDKGLLSGREQRRWIVTPDDITCPTCLAMEDQVVGLDEDFELPDGTAVSGPTAHPNCRCAQALVAPDIEDSEFEAAEARAAYSPDQPRDENGRWSDTGVSIGPLTGTAEGILADIRRGGNWTLRLQKRAGLEDIHEYSIEPKGLPSRIKEAEVGFGSRAFYDPELSDVREVDGRSQVVLKPGLYDGQLPDGAAEPGYLYRGMSWAEWQQAQRQGFVESPGTYNLGDKQAGLTYYSTAASQAENYASGFAPWQYKPTFDRPAVVVKVKDPGTARDIMGTERGLPGRVPLTDLAAVYEGHPYEIRPGYIELYRDYAGRYGEGSRRSPSARVAWRQAVVQPRAAYSPDQPRDEKGQWTAGGGFVVDDKGILESGLPAPEAALKPAIPEVGALGYKVKALVDVDRDVLKAMNVAPSEAKPLPAATAQGTAMALEKVRTEYPQLHEYVKNNVEFFAAPYDPNAGATTIHYAGHVAVAVNSAHDNEGLLNPAGADWTVAQRIAADALAAGKSKDDASRAAVESILTHEIGHVLDGATDGMLTREMYVTVALKALELGGSQQAFDWVKKTLGGYAATSPEEAVGEVLAASLAGRQVPEEFQFVVEAAKAIPAGFRPPFAQPRAAAADKRELPENTPEEIRQWAKKKATDWIRIGENPYRTAYSDDQPRDDHGRWVDEGGGGSTGDVRKDVLKAFGATGRGGTFQRKFGGIAEAAHATAVIKKLLAESGYELADNGVHQGVAWYEYNNPFVGTAKLEKNTQTNEVRAELRLLPVPSHEREQRTEEQWDNLRDYIQSRNPKAFHGTSSEALESIKQKGLVPAGGLGADAATLYSFNDPERPASVFISTDPDMSHTFGEYAAKVTGGKPVVLEIELPPDARARLHPDGQIGGDAGGAFRFEGTIPPEWIKRVGEPGQGRQPDGGHLKWRTLGDGLTIYAVFVVSDEPRAAYSDDQPRDDHGRWTDTGGAPPVANQISAKRATQWNKDGARKWSSPDGRFVFVAAEKRGRTNYTDFYDVATEAVAEGLVTSRLDARAAQKAFGAEPDQLAAHMLNGLPGDVGVTLATAQRGDIFELHIEAASQAAHMDRYLHRNPDGTLVAIHGNFEIDPDQQGKGLAKRVLAESMDAYEQMGVSRIELTANSETGGYAWARFGFKAEDPEDLARQLHDLIRLDDGDDASFKGKEIPRSVARKVKVVIAEHERDPRLPWFVAGLRVAGRHIGKELLRQTSWEAVMDLKDAEAVNRFRHYVRRAH